MSKTEILTAAFNKGFKAGKCGLNGIPASRRFKGSAENFYWQGYKKGAAELAAYHASPEYKAAQAEQRQRMLSLADAVNHITHGQHELARQILNEDLGMGIR